MNKLPFYLFTLLFVLTTSCSNRNKNIKEASLKVCNCFSGYTESDGEIMLEATKMLDSINETINLDAIPRKKLLKQMQKDCPKTASIVANLSQSN